MSGQLRNVYVEDYGHKSCRALAHQKKFGEIAGRQERVKGDTHTKSEKLRRFLVQRLVQCLVILIMGTTLSIEDIRYILYTCKLIVIAPFSGI